MTIFDEAGAVMLYPYADRCDIAAMFREPGNPCSNHVFMWRIRPADPMALARLLGHIRAADWCMIPRPVLATIAWRYRDVYNLSQDTGRPNA